MKVLSKLNATPVLLAFSLVWGLTMSQVTAEPMHTPTKMPMAKAESVGMSTDGLSRIDHLARRAKELNMPALALTDHGTMYGTIQFYRACKRWFGGTPQMVRQQTCAPLRIH